MKILILGFAKLKHMPYANFYIEQLINKKNVEIHMVFWNRDLKEEEKKENIIYHEFRIYQRTTKKKLGKLAKFYYYKKFVEEIIKKEEFEFLIFLHTFPAILLYQKATKHYRNRYIFDYRDITYEKYFFFRKMIYNLSKYSYITFTSSPNYIKFMADKNKILLSHNLLEDSLHFRNIRKEFLRERKTLRVAFWGLARGKEINLQLIKVLGNDQRFELHYYGNLDLIEREILGIIKEKKIENVFLHGPYEPTDRYEFASKTDLLHNLYEPDGNMENAIANKFYDGITFYIPQLCMKKSLMGEICMKNKVGIACDPFDSNFADEIYTYYKSIDWRLFAKNCDNIMENILKDVRYNKKKIDEIISI